MAFKTQITALSTETPSRDLDNPQDTEDGGADVLMMYVSSTDSNNGVGGGASSVTKIEQ